MLHVLFLDTAARWSVLFQEHRPVFWCVVLALVGIYLLLPTPGRASPRWQGGLLGIMALVIASNRLVHREAVLPEQILFFAFAGLAILGGVLLITQRNPVHAALSFALVVLATCGLFLLQAAPFLMAATIIVYAGAIVVTFLFVIMLAQQGGLSGADQRSREPFLASIAGCVLLGILLAVLQKTYDTSKLDNALQRLRQAATANTLEEVARILDDPPAFFEAVKKQLPEPNTFVSAHPVVTERIVFLGGLDNASGYWAGKNLVALKKELAKVHQAGQKLRLVQGSIQPDPRLPLSPFSAGLAPREEKERLPANNVAALGRSLFTDHLLAVELVGVLLTVATIGAIAIAGRRAEGLR